MANEQSEFARRIRAAREAAGLSQSELSTKMEPSPGRAWCGHVESGRIQRPDVETLKSAAVALGVREEWLILGNDPMVAPETKGAA